MRRSTHDSQVLLDAACICVSGAPSHSGGGRGPGRTGSDRLAGRTEGKVKQAVFPLRTSAVLLLAAACASGQVQTYPDSRIPRTKDGKPNLTAPAPRLNGKPDLSGLWQVERTPERDYAKVVGKEFSGIQ